MYIKDIYEGLWGPTTQGAQGPKKGGGYRVVPPQLAPL